MPRHCHMSSFKTVHRGFSTSLRQGIPLGSAFHRSQGTDKPLEDPTTPYPITFQLRTHRLLADGYQAMPPPRIASLRPLLSSSSHHRAARVRSTRCYATAHTTHA